METPQEKSKRLGVPLLPQIDKPAYSPELEPERKSKEAFFREIQEHMNEVVCVCTCGKEITRQIYVLQTPCGGQQCPFGFESN